MTWDCIHITSKISYLRRLVENSEFTNRKQKTYIDIVEALMTGSINEYSGSIGFEMNEGHIGWLKDTWDVMIANQKDDLVINEIDKDLTI